MFERTMLKIEPGARVMARRLLLLSCLMIPLVGSNAVNADVDGVDISNRVEVRASGFRLNRNTGKLAQAITLTNISKQPITGGLHLVLEGLNQGVQASSSKAAASLTTGGFPVLQLDAGAGSVLKPNEKINLVINFDRPSKGAIRYRPRVLNGSVP